MDTAPQAITTAVALAMLALLATDRLRGDLVAIAGALVLGFTGVLTQREVFSGFSSSAVITIMAVYILAEGLHVTGVNELLGRVLLQIGGTGEVRLLAIVMVGGAGLSLFMNNIAAASVLLPAVSAAACGAGVPSFRLLLPLAYATLLGGMATLLTSSNVIASSLLRSHGFEGFSLHDFAPVGMPMALAGVLYMVTMGRRLLPRRVLTERVQAVADAEQALVDLYQLGERLFRARVPVGSMLEGVTVSESRLRDLYRVSVLAIRRGEEQQVTLSPDTVLHVGDELLLRGSLADFRARDQEPRLEIVAEQEWDACHLQSGTIVVVEAMLGPRSTLIGKTLTGCRFRQRYGLNVLAVWRAGRQIRTGLRDLALSFGDALLLQGPREQAHLLRGGHDLILMTHLSDLPRLKGMRKLAMAVLACTLAAAGFLPDLTAEIMLGGAVVMLLLGMLTMDEAYRAVEWRTVFMLAGMLPLGLAMSKTGEAGVAAQAMAQVLGQWGPVAVMCGLFVVATLLTQALNGTAVAVVVVPVAIQAAVAMGADPRAFAMAAALGTSMAFVTPLGHPVDMLVMGQGGYSFRDYARVGLPLALIVGAVALLLLPCLWPPRVPPKPPQVKTSGRTSSIRLAASRSMPLPWGLPD